MKKNLFAKRILVGAAALCTMMSVPVMAEDISGPAAEGYLSPVDKQTQEAAAADGIMLISAEAGQEAVAAVNNYQLVSGTISQITQEDGYVSVIIDNENMGMIANVADTVFVIDEKDGSYKTAADLKEGMNVMAVLDNNSPMTMSLPPMTNGVVGFVIDSEESSTDLSVYDSELVNGENSLKLNIGDTVITDIQGSRVLYGAADLQNKELLVFYTVTTRSIPAQTTPHFVMILSEKEEPVALRSFAEGLGYKVVWTANDAPIVVEKGDAKIELTIGSDIVKVNGVAENVSAAPVLTDSTTYVGADVAEIIERLA